MNCIKNDRELMRLKIFSIFTQMKYTRQIVTIILSVYLLVLMVMPCTDAHSKIGTIEQTQVSQSDDDHHDLEICSPFCVCSSCMAAVILQPVITFEILHFEPQYKDIPSSYKSIVSSFHGSIWQPPQLV